jgi:hypothetical protein
MIDPSTAFDSGVRPNKNDRRGPVRPQTLWALSGLMGRMSHSVAVVTHIGSCDNKTLLDYHGHFEDIWRVLGVGVVHIAHSVAVHVMCAP